MQPALLHPTLKRCMGKAPLRVSRNAYVRGTIELRSMREQLLAQECIQSMGALLCKKRNDESTIDSVVEAGKELNEFSTMDRETIITNI